METIQGQLQLIVEQMPSLLHQQRLSPTEMRHLTSNGHTPSMEVPSPVSNDDHSPDTVDDTDDNTMENTHNQESPPSAKESREIPTLGTPASDGKKMPFPNFGKGHRESGQKSLSINATCRLCKETAVNDMITI